MVTPAFDAADLYDRSARTRIDSGVRAVTDSVDHVQGVHLVVSVAAGSRHDSADLPGTAHALEHVAFRTTHRFTSEEMLSLVEETGGEINAYTTAESISFETYLPFESLDLGVEVLSELVLRARLGEDDLERERPILLEEHALAEDEYSSLCTEALFEGMLGDHGLGHPVRGTCAGIEALTAPTLAEFRDRQFVASNLVVAAAGRVDHAELVGLVAKHFDDVATTPARATATPTFRPQSHSYLERDTDQAYLSLGWPAFAADDRRQPALDLVLWVLGGGMSSRLARDLREDRGLVYSIGAWNCSFHDAGAVGISTGCSVENLGPVIEAIRGHADRLRRQGLDRDELRRALGSVAGQFRLDGDSIEGRLGRLVADEVTFGRIVPIEEVMASYRAVNEDDVRNVVDEVLGRPPHVSVVGPSGLASIL